MTNDLGTIVSAIEHEANVSARPLEWTIHAREKRGSVWKVFVEPNRHNAQLDESLEGAAAWWPGPPRGSADVLSVSPEDLQINLRCATAPVPPAGRLKVYPVRFLDSLAEAWASPFRGPRFLRAYRDLEANSASPVFRAPVPEGFSELRPAQRAAFGLLSYRFSFLWGPPGSGKTHTLGAIVASFLLENPSARVLVLATTNTAVDIALVSVDKSLERLSARVPFASECRRQSKRLGAHFVAQHYKDRQHLIPQTDETLIQRLAELEASRPNLRDVTRYNDWRSALEAIRNRMRVQAKEVLENNRLVALTSTRGVFSCAELEETAPFDLIVFDEASQMGIANAMPFLPLARRVLFAGDPKQLQPIVTADDREVRDWLGRSPFELMAKNQANTRILDEQSRMVAPICHVVSQAFYDGRLRVCAKAAADSAWTADRRLLDLPLLGAGPLCCLPVSTEGAFHAGFRGYAREASAGRIAEGVRAALAEVKASDIAVLTPYRAQRTIIRRKLAQAGITGVEVSTVHRAQGGEKKTIFFDPVLGTHQAVSDRLINVALSRAKARLVITLSKGDLANRRLAQIAALMGAEIVERLPVQSASSGARQLSATGLK